MKKLKAPKLDRWQLAYPNLTNYPYPQSRQRLYYIQVGNALFLKVEGLIYTIEVNRPHSSNSSTSKVKGDK